MISKSARRQKVRNRIRGKISGTAERPRLSVYRSNKQIYAQIIDDISAHTLASASSKEVKASGDTSKVDIAKEVGKNLAAKAKSAGVSNVVFDRGGYIYHGRVKALAEGAREGGLEF